MNTPIRLGVLGCGFAAKAIHVPRLTELNSGFVVTSVCDVDAGAAHHVADLAGGARVYEDQERMFDSGDIDAVAVLTPLKTRAVKSALHHELDVFVEKPLAEAPEGAAEIARIAEDKGAIVFVGTMRRFDRAILLARSLLPDMGRINFVEVRDICSGGMTAASTDELVEPVLQSSFDHNAGSRLRNALQTALLEMVHDTAILRAMFEQDLQLVSATASGDGWMLSGSLRIGNSVPCTFGVCEYGLVRYQSFIQEVSVYGDEGILHLAFSDPKVPGSEATLTATGSPPVRISTDAYGEEWRAFQRCVRSRSSAEAGLHEAVRDLRLLWDVATLGAAS